MPAASNLEVQDRIRVEISDGVATISLNRPHKLNALDSATLRGLTHIAHELDARTEVKVAVIRGEGRAFSAGYDLAQAIDPESGDQLGSAETGREMAEAIAGMKAVTIASIHGHCIGGGVVLAAACDLRIASSDARFRIPEIDIGVPLYWAGIPLLARELGPSITKELVMTGRPFTTDEAIRFGFLNRVVNNDDLVDSSAELANTLAAKSALALRTTKTQVNNAQPILGFLDLGLRAEVDGMAEAFADPEGRRLAGDYLNRMLGGAQ